MCLLVFCRSAFLKQFFTSFARFYWIDFLLTELYELQLQVFGQICVFNYFHIIHVSNLFLLYRERERESRARLTPESLLPFVVLSIRLYRAVSNVKHLSTCVACVPRWDGSGVPCMFRGSRSSLSAVTMATRPAAATAGRARVPATSRAASLGASSMTAVGPGEEALHPDPGGQTLAQGPCLKPASPFVPLA